MTTRVVVIGVLLGGVMTAANAYLGLYVGMTVSASIPAAVMSMLILRGFKFKDVTILENNSVQRWQVQENHLPLVLFLQFQPTCIRNMARYRMG